MLRYLLILLVASPCFHLYAQPYQIPDFLEKDANEVIINDKTYFKILAIDNSEFNRKYLTKIQNKYADTGNSIELYYDGFRTIQNATITVYDKNFEKVENYKLKDFADISTKGGSVADDSRVKYLRIKTAQYPYYVEVDYTIRYKGSMHYPRWIPLTSEKVSLVSSTLIVENFLKDAFRYHSNVTATDSVTEENHSKFTWHVDSLPSYQYQKFSYDIAHYSPIVELAPNTFQMDGKVGEMSSWQSFGNWIYSLGENRNTLTEEQKNDIREIVKGMDKINTVKAVYHYLQANTRYVSIQLGIGGWQPFDSKFVHENKYGDCKALSFYTQSLLEAVDIPSYYTIIRAGSSQQDVHTEFPNSHFNHAILTVPLDRDTIWLECTSQTSPFGYMGSSTSDREALLVDKNGESKLIHTKSYTVKDNIQETMVNQMIQRDGSSTCNVKRIFKGMEIENDGFRRIVDETNKKQTEWFLDNHQWGNIKIDSLFISEISNEPVPKADMQINLQIAKAGTFMGNRLFYQPFIFTNIDYIKLSDKDRSVPLEIRFPYSQQDTIRVTFDDVYYIEKPIGDLAIESKFGNYSRTVNQDQNSFIITRKFQINKGKYDPSEYPSFKEFIEKVQKNDRERLVMINKT